MRRVRGECKQLAAERFQRAGLWSYSGECVDRHRDERPIEENGRRCRRGGRERGGIVEAQPNLVRRHSQSTRDVDGMSFANTDELARVEDLLHEPTRSRTEERPQGLASHRDGAMDAAGGADQGDALTHERRPGVREVAASRDDEGITLDDCS